MNRLQEWWKWVVSFSISGPFGPFPVNTMVMLSFCTGIVEVLDANAKRIEQAKLRAIGMRNRVITERENRDQKRRALQALVAEREADLARVEAQVKSLRQVEAEQQNIIDKLAVGEAYGRVPVEGTEEGF